MPFGFLGGHSGIGPPSGAGTLGTAAHANVPTRPTNRINALSERFIVFLLGIAEMALYTATFCGGALYTGMQVPHPQELTTT